MCTWRCNGSGGGRDGARPTERWCGGCWPWFAFPQRLRASIAQSRRSREVNDLPVPGGKQLGRRGRHADAVECQWLGVRTCSKMPALLKQPSASLSPILCAHQWAVDNTDVQSRPPTPLGAGRSCCCRNCCLLFGRRVPTSSMFADGLEQFTNVSAAL